LMHRNLIEPWTFPIKSASFTSLLPLPWKD
jgi:hypothetical protein